VTVIDVGMTVSTTAARVARIFRQFRRGSWRPSTRTEAFWWATWIRSTWPKSGCLLAGSGRRRAADHCHAHGPTPVAAAERRAGYVEGGAHGRSRQREILGGRRRPGGQRRFSGSSRRNWAMRRWRPAEQPMTPWCGIRPAEILTGGAVARPPHISRAWCFASPERLARLNALVHREWCGARRIDRRIRRAEPRASRWSRRPSLSKRAL